MPAFDEHRPPSSELIADCVHCGFCLPSCPTYALWGEEMDSPRGRIHLMTLGLEDDAEMTPAMATHFDRCLGCMACVTACPSGVQYDRLIGATRPQVERHAPRSRRERLLRRVLLGAFTRPGVVRALVPGAVAVRALGLHRRLAGVPGIGLAPDVPLSAVAARLPAVTPARGTPRGRVALLQGCVQRAFFPHVNRATVDVLAAEGFEVHAPRAPRCCGALPLHAGAEEQAAALARQTMDALEEFDAVVVNAAGCGSAMKEYGDLFAGGPDEERARAFSARVRDVVELLAAVEPAAERLPMAVAVAYHDACHLAHAQGIRAEPRRLLESIPGLRLVEPPEPDLCCGSAGLYNVLQPDAAAELGARKARGLAATGADVVAAANPGCILQIAAHLEATGRRVPVVHPVELLRASIAGRPLRTA